MGCSSANTLPFLHCCCYLQLFECRGSPRAAPAPLQTLDVPMWGAVVANRFHLPAPAPYAFLPHRCSLLARRRTCTLPLLLPTDTQTGGALDLFLSCLALHGVAVGGAQQSQGQQWWHVGSSFQCLLLASRGYERESGQEARLKGGNCAATAVTIQTHSLSYCPPQRLVGKDSALLLTLVSQGHQQQCQWGVVPTVPILCASSLPCSWISFNNPGSPAMPNLRSSMVREVMFCIPFSKSWICPCK